MQPLLARSSQTMRGCLSGMYRVNLRQFNNSQRNHQWFYDSIRSQWFKLGLFSSCIGGTGIYGYKWVQDRFTKAVDVRVAEKIKMMNIPQKVKSELDAKETQISS